MSTVIPNERDGEGFVAVENPVFVTRAERTNTSLAARMFNTVLYQVIQFDRQGIAVTAETIRREIGGGRSMTVRDVAAILASSKMQEALLERGIELESTTGLSPEQLYALSIYLDMTVPMNHSQKLRAAGVTDARWRGWMRQPAFAKELADLSEETLRASQPVALQRVAEAVDAGARWAIELSLEMTGRHDRRKETLDVRALLMGIFSVLDDEITDVAVLQRISDKIKQQMGAAQAPVLQISPATVAEPVMQIPEE